MVSTVCRDGYWSTQKWLRRTIGDEEVLIDKAIYIRSMEAILEDLLEK